MCGRKLWVRGGRERTEEGGRKTEDGEPFRTKGETGVAGCRLKTSGQI